MNMKEWAEKEVELACARERVTADDEGGDSPDFAEYGCACYHSALKAFNSLMEDGHSGFSIGITKNILMRLIDGKALTPIEDIDGIWWFAFERENGDKEYQCLRMSSLFKTVHHDGTVSYSDTGRVTCHTTENPNGWFYNGFIADIVDELFPITMPYIPENKPYVVTAEEFLCDPKNGDYDTLGILSITMPNGGEVMVQRYFAETEEGFVEITAQEYEQRKAKRVDKE